MSNRYISFKPLHVLVFDTFLDSDDLLLKTRTCGGIREVKRDLLSSWQSGRVQLQSKNRYLKYQRQKQEVFEPVSYFHDEVWWRSDSVVCGEMLPTFGPLVSPPDAPGTIPSEAFHLAKLSSSASSFAYSSADFAAPSLYPEVCRTQTVSIACGVGMGKLQAQPGVCVGCKSS
jgi:hypothetical protein